MTPSASRATWPSGKHVLLVQDERGETRILEEALRADGHRVLRFTSPVLALAHLHARVHDGLPLPDVIVVDEHLRGLRGIELLSWLRNMGWSKRAVVVIDADSREMRERAEALHVVVAARSTEVDAMRAVIAGGLR